MNKIIFKIQISVVTSASKMQVMVYNEDKSILGQFPMSKEIKQLAKGRKKFFVYGEMIGTEVNILSEAPWQNW